MFKLWGKLEPIAPIVVFYCLWLSSTKAMALSKYQGINRQNEFIPEVINRQENLVDYFGWQKKQTQLLSQMNRVEQLQDIKPTDWYYEALKSLIERYGCIQGFDDQIYRGEQKISRAEFVAGLNSCLNKIESMVASSDPIAQTDIETILRLMQEFQSELAILQGRTDGSQARLKDLEITQFSTTSKLQGEAIFGLGSLLSSNADNNTVLGSRLRLDLETSFNGDDLLLTRLSYGDFAGFVEEIETFQGNLAFADSDNSFELEKLYYTFGVGGNVDFILAATGVETDNLAPTINILDGDGGSGAISAFGTRNPISYPPGDAGIGVVHRPIDQIKISAGYLASSANEPSSGNGLFNGAYSALGQVEIAPFNSLSLTATYIHSYNQNDTKTGTNKANWQSQTAELFREEIPTVSNSYGLELSWTISDRLILGGWGGFSQVKNLSLNQQIDRGTQDIWNWAATLALPDLGKEGNLGGVVVGSEPTVTNSTIANLSSDRDRSLHLEAFYQYRINDNIAVTPGVVWITEPDSPDNQLKSSEDLVIGTVRTTFSF